jgi:Glycosyltransferase family 9 (heptosyltransferase)
MTSTRPDATRPEPDARTAILNGFGRTLGDGIIGLQALRVALDRGTVAPRPVLFRLPGLPALVQEVHAAAGFAEIETLPWDFETPARRYAPADRLGRVIDLRDFAFDPDFRRLPMIDFFLDRLGVDPRSVPAAQRRNAWLAPRIEPLPSRLPHGYVLVCPRASMRLRDMPDAVHDWILRQMLATHPVVTQGDVPPALAGDVIHAPRCATLAELATLVRNAAHVISTDTAMVHLADAFDVPCLAFFPTHAPDKRVRDYPRCRPVALSSTLPRDIEFARDDGDLALAQAAWFPDGENFDWLARTIAAAREALPL